MKTMRRLLPFVLVVLSIAPSLLSQETKVPDAQQIVGAPRGAALTGAELDRRTAEVASLLRCPVCQGLSIGDSPSAMAQNMKAQVRDLLARGYAQDQILSYFESSYGQFVLLEPKKIGVNWLVWLAPLGALLLGAVVVFFMLRKNVVSEPAQSAAVSPASGPPADPGLDPYLARVRELTAEKSNRK